MTRATLAIAVASMLAGAAASAAESERLDEGFLEYLAEFEDDGDDWTWFADDEEEEKTPVKAAAAPKPPVKGKSEDKVDP